ncbi:MAG: DASH family cryptochrome [Zoogloea sp.]|nr:DASH family cryptochrome [Zoogloea sp.]
MSPVLFWFRHDLRLHDQPALLQACSGGAHHLVPVFCLPDLQAGSPWGFTRVGPHRRAWLVETLQDLAAQLAQRGCPLLVCPGPATTTLPRLAAVVGASRVVCEDIAAPEEQAEVEALGATGLTVHTVWHSSLLDPARLPWATSELPATFTAFRQAVEKAQLQPAEPLPAPSTLPPWPPDLTIPPALSIDLAALGAAPRPVDRRSSIPAGEGGFRGGETAGLAHLARYLARRLPDSYKQTRNGLSGPDYSSKWSPWLATGALSARRILAELRRYEAEHGATEGSYWLWFELLWRDYFRFLHLQHGCRLYRARGLGNRPNPPHDAAGFERWRRAATGEPLVDAAMRELRDTGYLSNRLRQVVASYLLHELGGDWRAGAAWFEACLVDYDVYSNQGNWLYIAGRGTDPRGGRRFSVLRQSAEHDPDCAYQRLWSAP